LLQARRFEGRSKDLWTTFNRVEENLVRRGLHGCAANDRAVKTREVRGVDQTIKLKPALPLSAGDAN
jgi:hypothetical protein